MPPMNDPFIATLMTYWWLIAAAIGTVLVVGLLKRIFASSPRYYPRKWLFTKSEWKFYRQLQDAVRGDYLIMGKVRIADLLAVSRGLKKRQWWRAFTKISSKHVDYVLVHPGTGRVVCAIELDDSSHLRQDRRQRDAFVNKAFAQAQLPLLRVPTSSRYDGNAIRAMIIEAAKRRNV